MDKKTMREVAKNTCYWDDFHAITNEIKGLSDEDLNSIAPAVKQFILASKEKDPVRMFDSVFDEIDRIWSFSAPFPMGGGFHHYILPGVILSCLRNAGYEITDRDIEEGMKRGSMLAAHSCGFTGISGAAHSVGIVVSIVNFRRRCCKRSNIAGIEHAVRYLSSQGYTLPVEKIECKFASGNGECSGEECPYYPKQPALSK